MKTKLLLLFLTLTSLSFTQDMTINFSSENQDFPLDSIQAMNLRTSEMVSFEGSETLYLLDVSSVSLLDMAKLELLAYPNPFAGSSTVLVQTVAAEELKLELYNQLGQLVINRVQTLDPGQHAFIISVSDPGMYTLNVSMMNKSEVVRLISTESRNSSNRIDFIGSEGWINGKKISKSSVDNPTLDFFLGDEIRYTCFSGPFETILQDEPREAKELSIPFYACIDPDRNFYSSVIVGDQAWMGENLTYLPSVGEPIDNQMIDDKLYYVNGYMGTDINAAKETDAFKSYGVLYNWNAAMDACPDGWHLPSDDEWKVLEGYLGMTPLQRSQSGLRNSGWLGRKLKSLTAWYNNGNGDNSVGLNLTPGGLMEANLFRAPGKTFWTWTSTLVNDDTPRTRYIMYNETGINRYSAPTSIAGSVRCIKTEATSVSSFDGVKINYESSGEGLPTLVLIHGWTNTLHVWDEVVDMFKSKYNVVAVELAGFGRSGNNRTEWTMSAFAEDVKAVLQEVDTEHAILVGFSMGGPVAIEAANKMPDIVKGVVLVDVLKNITNKYSENLIDSYVGNNMNFVNNLSLIGARASFETNKDELAQRYIDMVKNVNKTGWEESIRNFYLWRNDCEGHLSELICPLHAINSSGSNTNVTAIRNLVPSFKAKFIDGVGHLVFWEALEEFSGLLQESIDEMFQMEAGYAPVNGTRLYYEAKGDGEPLIFIHGSYGDRRHWNEQLTGLSSRFKVIRYDIRGYGRSDKPIPGQYYKHIDDLNALLDYLGVEKAHIAGFSSGCTIAGDFVLANPDRCLSFIAVGPWLSGINLASTQEVYNDYGAVANIFRRDGAEAARDFLKGLHYLRPHKDLPNVLSQMDKVISDYDFWSFSHTDPAQSSYPTAFGRMNKFDLPTLIITASHDIVACQELADLMETRIGNAQKVKIDQASHIMMLEEPDLFNNAIINFIEGI